MVDNRRAFLKAFAAAGAASLAPSSGLFGQERVLRPIEGARQVKVNVRGGAIDVHHHFQPPGGTGNRPWSPEMSLEQMDKFGIGVAILSMTQNGELLYNGTEKGRAAVRAGNEYGAKLMQQHPKKFGLMGGIPMPDLEGSLREVEYTYDTLKVDAIGIYRTTTRGGGPATPISSRCGRSSTAATPSSTCTRWRRVLQRPQIRRRGAWWNTTSTSRAASSASSSTA